MTGTIDPALFGMPDATTAGVPSGTTLATYTGPMTITTDGTVIDGKIINGTLRVTADNVTIQNCVIQNYGFWGVDAEGSTGITIKYCDFTASSSMDTNAAILGSGTFIGNDISNSENGIVLQDGASVVRDNYIHDLGDNFGDPHIDGISVQGGQNHVLIEHNTVESWDTSCIFIKNDFGPINDIVVRNNLLYGDMDRGDPAATIYVYGPNTTNVLIENNYVEKGNWFYYATSNATPVIRNNVEWNNNTDPTPYPDQTPDTTPPSAPIISGFADDTAPLGDHITTDHALTLSGTAEANSTVTLYEDDVSMGTTAANASGGWTFATGTLADDTFHFSAKATDAAGNTSVESAVFDITVQTAPPPPPVDQTINGNNSNNVLTGGASNDTINGNGGNDTINGGAGNDTIHGGAGKDTINGGPGTDTLWGDAGNDTFVFRAHEANGDVLADFAGNGKRAGDSIDFFDYGAGTVQQIDATHWQVNSADGQTHDVLTLLNGATLHPTDFHFM